MSSYVTAGALQKFGGAMGALAVGLGAYGTHGLPSRLKSLGLSEADILKNKGVWATASQYHLVHSAVLLAAPVFVAPHISGTAIALGMVMFSGSCYAVAFTGDRSVGKLAPVGGMLLIAGWASFALLSSGA